jgi:xylulokinase
VSLLGIDAGTTGCKAAAFSIEGRCLAMAYREYPTLQPKPGWAELDSRQVFAMVLEVIAEVAAQTTADPITAISVSSMGEAMTPVSQDRRILGNCILSAEVRGAEYIDQLEAEMGQEAVYAINPNILAPNYSLPKLLWLRENEADLFQRTWKFLLWADLIPFLLGCDAFTSHSLANRTLLFDIRKEDWSDTLLDWSGLDRNLFAPCVAGGTVVGTVAPGIARDLGLPSAVTVVSGGHDQCCNALGAGIVEAGKAACGIGTIECIAPVYGRIPESAEMLPLRLNIEHHVLPGLYLSFIYNQSGVLVKWFRNAFARAERQILAPEADLYTTLLAEMPPGPTRLLALPHFDITGAPDFISNSAGLIAGLRTSTARGEILKALIEGATFYFVESLDALKALDIDTSEFIATGGGAQSDAWLQIKADILDVPFVRLRHTECGLAGAAMLAGLATGVYASPAEAASRFVRRDRVFTPDPVRHRQYHDRYRQYRRLYPALQEILCTL